MKINIFKDRHKLKLNKTNECDSENALSVDNNEINNYLTIFSDNEYDHYGFEKNKECSNETSDNKDVARDKKYIERRWNVYLSFRKEIKKNFYLKALIRRGIPDKLRPQIWPHLLDSMILYLKYPTVYEKCLNTELEPKIRNQIELDIIRTFPNNKNYQRNSVGLVHLKNVLHAFAIYKPKINYCQSMNFVTAITLIFLKEELAFWSIVQLIDSDFSNEKLSISEYYNNGMCGLRRDILVIEELIKMKMPEVHSKLKELEVDMSWICSEWLLCLYCTAFPITTTLRIWDCLFYEGDKILFRIALALFKLNEKKILELHSLEAILFMFKNYTKNMVETDKLMHSAFHGIGVLKKKKIKKLRMVAEDIIKKKTV